MPSYIHKKSKLLGLVLTFIMPLCWAREYNEKNLSSCQSFPVAIYHAFDEKFIDIENNIEDLKAAGFSHIQVSPIQEQDTENPKNITTWWNAYRPISYDIGGMYGNETQFKSLLRVATNNGLKIIVDVVLNHLGPLYKHTQGFGIERSGAEWKSAYTNPLLLNAYLDQVIEKYQKIGLNKKECFREPKDWGFGGSGKKFPSLNFDNPDVRNIQTKFLDTLLDMGVSGFRFDAISAFSNDFWHYLNTHIKEKSIHGYSYAELLTQDMKLYKKFQEGCSDDNDVHTMDFILYYEMGKAFPYGCNLSILQMPNLNNDPWAVTFSDNHDTFSYREDASKGVVPSARSGLPGWTHKQEILGDDTDRLLATLYLLVRKGGVPLILNKMYAPNKEIIKKGLTFRRAMINKNAPIEHINVINDNIIKIDRGDTGFAIINKSNVDFTFNMSTLHMYDTIGDDAPIDDSITIHKRSARFFIKK